MDKEVVRVGDFPSRLQETDLETLEIKYSLTAFEPVLLEDDQRADTLPSGKMTVYAKFLEYGLYLPVLPLCYQILKAYRMPLAQMTPNFITVVLALVFVCGKVGAVPDVFLFRCFYKLVRGVKNFPSWFSVTRNSKGPKKELVSRSDASKPWKPATSHGGSNIYGGKRAAPLANPKKQKGGYDYHNSRRQVGPDSRRTIKRDLHRPGSSKTPCQDIGHHPQRTDCTVQAVATFDKYSDEIMDDATSKIRLCRMICKRRRVPSLDSPWRRYTEDSGKDKVVLTSIVDAGVSPERSPERAPLTSGGRLDDSNPSINLTLPDPNPNPDSCPYYSIISRALIESSLEGENQLSNLEGRLRDAIRAIQNSELEALRAAVINLKKEVANLCQTNLDQEKYWEDHVKNFVKMDA
ncbi:OLC1v1008472C1 [Oldenlandia corymbosa var. corymbosa]|uniref:OLC1v1008472C1 n=1 Tax=Oldenlandia corymbosa var. corymbosa TaxID=529605 RepID=A0AAV1DM18_OLDCO|nr:OLC1v1008472C1 [Oldenlandia corymbosa var. corymbosa]